MAQQNGDGACVAYALAWLHHNGVGSIASAVPRDAGVGLGGEADGDGDGGDYDEEPGSTQLGLTSQVRGV